MSHLNLIQFKIPGYQISKPRQAQPTLPLQQPSSYPSEIIQYENSISLERPNEQPQPQPKAPIQKPNTSEMSVQTIKPHTGSQMVTTEMEFLEVNDIEDSKDCPQVNLECGAFIIPEPTHAFLDVRDIGEMSGPIPIDKFAERDRLEREMLLKEEEDRLRKLKNVDYKQSKEYKLKLLNQQLNKAEKDTNSLEKFIKDRGTDIETTNQKYEKEKETAKKNTALDILNRIEHRIEKVPPEKEEEKEIEMEDATELLQTNSKLYEDINKSFSKSKKETKKFYQKPLVPKLKPQGSRTKRISEAMALAEEAIKLSFNS